MLMTPATGLTRCVASERAYCVGYDALARRGNGQARSHGPLMHGCHCGGGRIWVTLRILPLSSSSHRSHFVSHSGGGHARAHSGASATARSCGARIGEMALAAPRALVVSDAKMRRGTDTWTSCCTFSAASRSALRLFEAFSLTLDTCVYRRRGAHSEWHVPQCLCGLIVPRDGAIYARWSNICAME